jgi:hypothetical protein
MASTLLIERIEGAILMMPIAASMIFALVMLVAFEQVSVGIFMTLVGIAISLATFSF